MYRLSFLLLLISCAQVTSLNLQKHQFGKIPTKIVWLQVAGLTEEHLALIKYSQPLSEANLALENSLCIGKAWEYNLFELRPKAYDSFMSQLTGKKNIKSSCEDYLQAPVWSYLKTKNYKVGIFEGEMQKENSLLRAKKCENENTFLQDTYMWKMQSDIRSDDKLFHHSEQTQYEINKVYYDRSCKTGSCFSRLEENIKSIHNEFSKNAKNYFFLIRDFKFQNLLIQNRIKEAREHLRDLDKVVESFKKYSLDKNDFLMIITSAQAKNVSFPRQGHEWAQYEKSSKFIKNKNSQLISPVFVFGARAENFCGIYNQSEILSRMFSGAKQQGLEFTILNPFSDD